MPLKVLSVLDTARTRYYHIKAVIVAGMGIFTDAYDLFCIPPITKLLGHIYYKKQGNRIRPGAEAAMLAVALLGTVIGQIVFGWLGDRVGRRRVYGLTLMLMLAGSIGCGFSMGTTQGRVLASLGFFRFLLGVGIGGDYPLSATIMSEFANKRTRGAFIAAVFSMQGIGILASSIVTMAVCKIFGRIYHPSQQDPRTDEADMAWRLILMLGAVPTALTYYWRMMMPETARYTALVELNVLKAAQDMERVLDVSLSQIVEDHPFPPSPPSYPLFSKQFFLLHGRDLLACSAAWFLLDIVFYSNNLCQSHIFGKHHNASETNTAFEAAFKVAKLQAKVACYSTIPGYFAAIFLIDRLGRVRIQVVGFVLMAILYFSSACIYWDHQTGKLFTILYGLTFFFANCGPNTTTFIVPAELFPARFRSTCHGIAGAWGKVGAMIGAVGFFVVSKDVDQDGYKMTMRVMLIILGGICVVGMAVTMLFTRETMGTSLEENENENGDQSVQGKCFP
ncbi:probable inorganic phosphate transporter 1-8 [Syzygium oleosum]|uniref:probable inorganic phosphate transporter 1-8 n=1 Tax=Syzygium oleosum TaxID=219896 RepID=UPI0024B8E505|nr:probable inorganic phosphate transporter 1-8 [Syzygium oleosum]